MTKPTGERDRAFAVGGFRDFLALEAGHSRHTVISYMRDVRRLAEYVSQRGLDAPEAIAPKHLREFLYHLKDLGLAPSSIRRHISSIRTYYRFLVSEGFAPTDPSERIELPKVWRKLPEVLTHDEVEALLGAPSLDEALAWRDRALLEVAYATGVRVSELIGLGVSDVWYDDRLVRVLGKGAKEIIRFNDEEAKELGISPADERPDAEWLQLISANPKLLVRPIVINGDKAAICRPPENVLGIL